MGFWKRMKAASRRVRSAAQSPRRVRLVLESLEERCVPAANGYLQINLASDVPALASTVDSQMVNPWGLSFSPTGPFWFSESGASVSDSLDGAGQPVAFLVKIPSVNGEAAEPTGTVFYAGNGFVISENSASRSARFLFATEQGTIVGWNGLLDENNAILAVDNSTADAAYTGLALGADSGGNTYLYAADFGRGGIDVFDEQFNSIVRAGAFVDPNLPAGYSAYNIQNINGQLFVTYAQHNPAYPDGALFSPGNGIVDVYDLSGNLLRRFTTGGVLNAAWGMTQAPSAFGEFGGAILIGNVGDGRINAFDPTTGAFLGALADDRGTPIEIPGLWSITFGNGHMAGDVNTLFFTAGVGYFQHGLFGAIQAPSQRGMSTAGDGIYDPNAPGEAPDYPVPPSSGPSLSDPAAPASSTVVLLPAADSSVLLVPTLSVVARAKDATPAPGYDPSAAGLLLSTLVASGNGFAGAATNQAANNSLNTLLDLRSTSATPGNSNATNLAAFGRSGAAQSSTESAAVGGWLAALAKYAREVAPPPREVPTPNIAAEPETQNTSLEDSSPETVPPVADDPIADEGIPARPTDSIARDQAIGYDLRYCLVGVGCIVTLIAPGVWAYSRRPRKKIIDKNPTLVDA